MKPPNSVDLHVGERLKTIRRKAGWKRVDLAAETGIEPETLRQFEYGLERISPRVLMKLAKALRVELGQIVGGFSAPKPVRNDVNSDTQEEAQAATLLRHFRRIRDAKTRALILSLCENYAENERANEGE